MNVSAGRRPFWRYEVVLAAAVVAILVVLGLAVKLTEDAAIEDAGAELGRKLELYSGYIESELKRYALLSDILSVNHQVRSALAAPDDPVRVAEANAQLKVLAETSGAAVAYVLDTTGLTLASSNYDSPVSFVGENYAFRPYFTEALAGGRGRYVAVGSTSHVAGYYSSAPVMAGGRVVGVVVTKWELNALVPWREGQDKVLVAGSDGIIFAANEASLLFKRANALGQVPSRAVDPRQYGKLPLRPLRLHSSADIGGIRVVTFDSAVPRLSDSEPVTPVAEYAVASKMLNGVDWRLFVLADVSARTRDIVVSVALAILGLALAGVMLGYVNQRRRHVRDLYEAAIRDPLTGLYTRLYMNDVVGRMIEGHDRGSLAGIALVIFDLDHFKQVNDTYGHHVGDQVLVGFGAAVLDAVRATDVPVRFGGEEVAVFLACAHLDDAVSFAERIRQWIEQAEFTLSNQRLRVTVSGGVALRRPGEPLGQLVVRADAALYEAKRAGRNRIQAATEAELPLFAFPDMPPST